MDKSQFIAPPTQARHRATNGLARSLAKHSKADFPASKRLLRFLCNTLDLGLMLQIHNKECATLTVFADSDWTSERPTRKIRFSWVILPDGAVISAGARTQSVVALSPCEADIAATAATSEAMYNQALFTACGQQVHTHLRSDSTGAMGVASRKRLATPSSSGRPLLVVAGRVCSEACSNQRSAWARER